MSSTFLADWLKSTISGHGPAAPWYACRLDSVSGHAVRRDAHAPAPLDAEEAREWREFVAPFGPAEPLLANIDALTRPGTLAVVTGQQAGLFGGPLYTITKAISAIHWARRIARETGRVVVPVFWVASDDHDFAEIATHSWLDGAGKPRTFAVPENPGESGRAVFARELPATLGDDFVREFEAGLAPSPQRDAVASLLRAASAPGATWESQFVHLLVQWFGSEGLVPVAPRLGFMRRRAVPVMRAEIEAHTASSAALREAGDRLSALGAKGLVLHRHGDEANFFVEVDGTRGKVVWQGSEARIQHPRTSEHLAVYSAESLTELLRAHPAAFSPNAALRPLVQDVALPTVAYVGGPSEVLYHAQIGCLYERFGVFRPAVILRASMVLVEPAVARQAEKLGVAIQQCLAEGADAVRARAAAAGDESGIHADVTARLADVRNAVARLSETVHAHTGDTALVKSVEKMQQGFDTGAEKLVERLTQLLSRRNEEATKRADRIADALWPDGEPQERRLGALSPLMTSLGTGGPAQLAGVVDGTSFERQIVMLGELKAPAGA